MVDPGRAAAPLVRQVGSDRRIGRDADARRRQVAIVTGAANGIGRAMTLGLLEQGICVLGVDRESICFGELEEEAGGEVASSLHTVLADLTDPICRGGQ
jgi:NADP-dependent 3-hydroxy acid dehydrogenase YdfG